MPDSRVTSVMLRRAVALALFALALVPAAPAAAEQTEPQKLFRRLLLADRGVAKDVKQALRNGGFVDRDVRFGDLTGDTKDDAVVLVNDGGSAGRIAVYIFSSHRRRRGDGGGAGGELRVLYRNQHLFRAKARLRRAGQKRPQGALVYSTPVFDPGDQLSDPAARKYVEVRWRPRKRRFGVASRRTIDNVRSRHCSRTGDFCTETIKSRGGAIYLQLRSLSFNGRYTLCVTTPAGKTDCRFFTLRRSGDRFVSQVRWKAKFPDGGQGRYEVVWRLGQQQLGPPLGFRIA
jgi:hypothetical protein